ncbi:MAG: conjugal transfer protein TraG [Acetatifactor sp.]|nr:conjugal transfer protein TraG [Acetatifactor sp.]
MNGEKIKLLFCLPYAFLFWVFDKAAEAYRLSAGENILTKAVEAVADIEAVFRRGPLPSIYPNDLAAGIVCTAAVWAFVYLRGKNNKKYRPGVEYGSARWGA